MTTTLPPPTTIPPAPATPPARRPGYRRAGFLAGLVAGGVLTAVMVALARGLGLFSLPELLGYRLIGLLPLAVFSFMVETFGGNAKKLLLLGATIGQIVVGGGLGVLWASLASTFPGEVRPARRAPSLWNPNLAGGAFFAILLFVVVEIAVFPMLDVGPFGVRLPAPLGLTTAATAILALIYGLTLAWLYRALMVPAAAAQPATPRAPLTRRQFIARAISAVAALAIGAGAIVGVGRQQGGGVAKSSRGGRVGNNALPPEITPIDDFYSVSKNFADPKVAEQGWSVQIGGQVERPYGLTLAQIKALPSVTESRTLCCISNEVGGDLISNGTWTGVRLKDILERAGVKTGAVDLAISARDGYTDSIAIDRALNGDVIAVYEMNGETLPDKNGFPLRLLVPDIYGMKNVKWVTKLDVIAFDYKGYWQEQGWNDVAQIKTMSRIDYPRSREVLPTGPAKLGGVAFAGARGVAKVEVSPDGGATWREAQLRRPLGPYAWVLWTAQLDLAEGDHRLMVRATDGKGVVQTDRPAPPAPDGSSGWHAITVRAAPGVPAPAVTEGQAPQSPFAPPANNGVYTP